MKSGEGGFMSAVLNQGMRAVSIGVNATTGNAGFVSPGDRVDLLVTHHVKVPQGNAMQDYVVSETFVRDVRVVAVDQMIDNPENKAILAKTVTVEVTPHQAEEVAVAMDMGKISIALRSAANAGKAVDGDEDKRTSTSDSDISQMLAKEKTPAPAPDMPADTRPAEPPPSRVQVIHGDKIENMDFTQGNR
jgi:pilus assembly protein CpaB